jgi:hypothetical protein
LSVVDVDLSESGGFFFFNGILLSSSSSILDISYDLLDIVVKSLSSSIESSTETSLLLSVNSFLSINELSDVSSFSVHFTFVGSNSFVKFVGNTLYLSNIKLSDSIV